MYIFFQIIKKIFFIPSFVGELGWELHIPSTACVPVYMALMEAGEEFGLVNAGYRAIDSLRYRSFPALHLGTY